MKKISSVEKNTIGEVAELLNISAETIRKFQRKGIIQLDTDEVNGYRYFNLSSINKLLRFLFYKKCGFDRDESHNLLNLENLEHIYGSLDERLDEIDQEIEILKLKTERLSEVRSIIRNIESGKEKVIECQSPEFYYVSYYRENELQMENRKAMNRIVEQMPFSSPAPVFRHSENLEYGMIIEKRYCRELNTEGMEYFPSSKALYTIVENSEVNYLNPDHFTFLKEYMIQHGLQVDLIIGRTILSMNNLGKTPSRYHEIWAVLK